LAAPLSPSIWYQRLHYIRQQIHSIEDGIVEQLLRHAFHLTQLAPGPLKELLRPRISENAFERLMSTNNIDLASLTIISDFSTYFIQYEKNTRLYAVSINF
jgi:hypothetical protein